MKGLIFALALVPGIASADWLQRCDPPASKSADSAASITAAAIVKHLINVDYLTCLEGGGACKAPSRRDRIYVSKEDSIGLIAGHSRMVFQFFRPGSNTMCAWGSSTEKPGAPYVAAWDKLSAANKARVQALGLAPE
jgi:hypothetical protein